MALPPDDRDRAEIECLLRRFRGRGLDAAIARVAKHVLYRRGELDASDLESILQEVRQPKAERWRQSAVACWALRHLDPPGVQRETVVGALCLFADHKQEDFPGNAVSRVVAFVTLVLSLLTGSLIDFFCLPKSAIREWAFGNEFWVFAAEAAIFGSCMLLWFVALAATLGAAYRSRLIRRSAEPRHQAMLTLGAWKPLAAVGPLAREATEHHDEQALHALLDILSQARTSDYGRLSAVDQDSLGRLLHHLDPQSEIAVSVLRAIGRLCGGPLVPLVSTLAGDEGLLSEAAREILPALKQRQRQEQDSARLIRPAAAPPNERDTLVRPCEPAADGAAALLRPTIP